MSIDANDPRLTAYALGELAGEERAAFERELNGDAALLEEIDAIAAMASLLEGELASEEGEGLGAKGQEAFMAGLAVEASAGRPGRAVEGAACEAPSARVIPFPFWKVGLLASAAASVLLLLVYVGTATMAPGDEAAVASSEAGTPERGWEVAPPEQEGQEGQEGEQGSTTEGLKVPVGEAPSAPPVSATPPPDAVSPTVPMPPPVSTEPVVASADVANGDGHVTITAKPQGVQLRVDGRLAGGDLGTLKLQQGFHGVVPGQGQADGYGAFGLLGGHQDEDVDGIPTDGDGRWRSGVARGESYAKVEENAFKDVRTDPLSTFSVDVDTASYSNVRRFLRRNTLPPMDAVRIEELINYFDYSYAPPQGDDPFAVHLEVADSPFDAAQGGAPARRLVRIGLKGREIHAQQRPPSNLVFLLDVSGSMEAPNKLPLLKQSLGMLVKQLGEKDRVAIVVYAGASGLALPSTSANQTGTILGALNRLNAGGSTNGGAGLELAYRVATEHFVPGGTNRVILATDGDFNVGVTHGGDLQRLIEDKARSGVFLSVLGFGMGDLHDRTMETLADKGNGNYAYIDTPQEAQKVLVDQLSGTLVTIAKDVKLQVEFNPAQVQSYRLVGYSNRMLAARDFNDDQKDAGEIGAGHAVTALYEVIPVRGASAPGVDPLKYQAPGTLTPEAASRELLTVKLRFKQPDGDTSTLRTFPLEDAGRPLSQASADLRFAAAVAMYGQLLAGSAYNEGVTWARTRELAQGALGVDAHGYRREFVELVDVAARLER